MVNNQQKISIYLLLAMLHKSSTCSIIGAKGILTLASRGFLAVNCTKLSGWHFTIVARKAIALGLGLAAIASKLQPVTMDLRLAVASIQAYVTSSRANIYLILAL
jgi:hypothetical protein